MTTEIFKKRVIMKHISTFFYLLMLSSTAFSASCETKREVFIDNELTKVWKTTVCPNQRLPFHTHEHARVVIPQQSGTLKVIYKSGKQRFIHLKKQIPILLSKSQGHEPHQDVNIGKQEIQVTVIELKQ